MLVISNPNRQSIQDAITPQLAIEILKDGNQRFVNNGRVVRDLQIQVTQTAKAQFPIATIVSCIDSRVPAEIIFDQGIGDIFSARIAGNFVNTDILGSLEFACKIAGSKAIVVVGHSHCGAIKGACDHVELGHLTSMLANIEPAIQTVKKNNTQWNNDNVSSKDSEYVQAVCDANILYTVNAIREQSPVLAEMEANNEIVIAGAMYELATGEVKFF